MFGCQRYTQHFKPTGYKSECSLLGMECSNIHISAIFRKIVPKKCNTHPIETTVPIQWKLIPKVELVILNKGLKGSPPYQGLIDNEPIRTVWSSRQEMQWVGAHGQAVKGVHSRDKIIYSVIDNGEEANKINEKGEFEYFGYNNITYSLKGKNSPLRKQL